MLDRWVVVLDVGKTLAKLTLWNPKGTLVERRTRLNDCVRAPSYAALDIDGIETWLQVVLSEFATIAPVGTIVPVAHGAAMAIVDKNGPVVPPIDYEDAMPTYLRLAYDNDRDPFSLTGSPTLPGGLNLGAQLFRLEQEFSELWNSGGQIVTWPQYWARCLTGVAATEVTSLGCHTDLWQPFAAQPSRMAVRRGWSEHFAPLRAASEKLGTISQDWQRRTGLPADCGVLCGLHDSNAALLAARAHPEIAQADLTVLSTGTWFIAMRSPAEEADINVARLDEARDCLVNVDVRGRPVPSARFMGGREAELLATSEGKFIDVASEADRLLKITPRLVSEGRMAVPSFSGGTGPFPDNPGHWLGEPHDELERRAACGLYLALMADVSLDLIGSCDCLVIEGRFAADPVFTAALASLRPQQKIYLLHAQNAVAYGAIGLLRPGLMPPESLLPITPLDINLGNYADRWHAAAKGGRHPS